MDTFKVISLLQGVGEFHFAGQIGTDAFALGSRQNSSVVPLNISAGEPAEIGSPLWQGEDYDFRFSSGALYSDSDGQSLWLWDHLSGTARHTDLANGRPTGGLNSLTDLDTQGLLPLSNDLAVSLGSNHLDLLRVSDPTSWERLDRVYDKAKSNARASSGLIVDIKGEKYVVTASDTDGGLSAFVLENNSLVLRDTIGAKDGLWTDGISAIKAVNAGDTCYILAASSGSNVVVSLRLNPNGVFFVEDIVWDDRNTRFTDTTDLTTFAIGNRNFVALGGSDKGLSLFELLPDGRLWHHNSIAQTIAWDIGAVTKIEAVETVSGIQLFVSGTKQNGIAQLALDPSDLGQLVAGDDGADELSGGEKEDFLMGGSGDDYLFGGGLDDTLIGGEGADTLSGGEGADVFVFENDGQIDLITDFQKGLDRLDLREWGRLYDPTALSISATTQGARIEWQNQRLDIHSKSNQSIDPSEWSADDFIF